MNGIRIGLWIAATAVAATGCAKGAQTVQSTDSTARNLTLAPSESATTMRDVPAPAATPRPPAPPRPAAPATPRAPAQPPTPATRSVAAGTEVALAVDDTITTRRAKAGDSFTATVGESVRDAAGRVVIPAGASASGVVVRADPAPNPRASGHLELSVTNVTVGGQTYQIAATVIGQDTVMQGRGITGGTAAKVGAGTALGALAGHFLGKSAGATILGGAAGAATGAVVADRTRNLDVVLPKGATVRIKLTDPLTVSAP